MRPSCHQSAYRSITSSQEKKKKNNNANDIEGGNIAGGTFLIYSSRCSLRAVGRLYLRNKKS
jgi:hypothetical protein